MACNSDTLKVKRLSVLLNASDDTFCLSSIAKSLELLSKDLIQHSLSSKFDPTEVFNESTISKISKFDKTSKKRNSVFNNTFGSEEYSFLRDLQWKDNTFGMDVEMKNEFSHETANFDFHCSEDEQKVGSFTNELLTPVVGATTPCKLLQSVDSTGIYFSQQTEAEVAQLADEVAFDLELDDEVKLECNLNDDDISQGAKVHMTYEDKINFDLHFDDLFNASFPGLEGKTEIHIPPVPRDTKFGDDTFRTLNTRRYNSFTSTSIETEPSHEEINVHHTRSRTKTAKNELEKKKTTTKKTRQVKGTKISLAKSEYKSKGLETETAATIEEKSKTKNVEVVNQPTGSVEDMEMDLEESCKMKSELLGVKRKLGTTPMATSIDMCFAARVHCDGAYSPTAKKAAIARYLEKRNARVWSKKIRYSVRKDFADSRIRVKGRFISKEQQSALMEGLLML